MTFTLPKIYPITDVGLSGIPHAEQVRRLVSGGARLIQLREKDRGAARWIDDARDALAAARDGGAKLIINDRVDVAMVIGADGVHLGQDDLPPADAARVRIQRDTATRTASMDASLMRLALRNLLSNALKFSPPDAPVTLRIAEVRTDPHDSSGDLLLYALELQDAETGTWANVCNADPYGERWAFPVQGSWDAQGSHVNDATRFSVACTAGVIAKCMRWGYKPFRSVNGQSLAPYHQACTRMARADYCGNGTPHTEAGTSIDVEDNLGVQRYDSPGALELEATWGPAGATCVSQNRRALENGGGDWLASPGPVSLNSCSSKRFR